MGHRMDKKYLTGKTVTHIPSMFEYKIRADGTLDHNEIHYDNWTWEETFDNLKTGKFILKQRTWW